MKLVEIVRTDDTSEDTFQAAKAFVQKIGKVGITAKDTPGFVVNRLLVPFIAQVRAWGRGEGGRASGVEGGEESHVVAINLYTATRE